MPLWYWAPPKNLIATIVASPGTTNVTALNIKMTKQLGVLVVVHVVVVLVAVVTLVVVVAAIMVVDVVVDVIFRLVA